MPREALHGKNPPARIVRPNSSSTLADSLALRRKVLVASRNSLFIVAVRRLTEIINGSTFTRCTLSRWGGSITTCFERPMVTVKATSNAAYTYYIFQLLHCVSLYMHSPVRVGKHGTAPFHWQFLFGVLMHRLPSFNGEWFESPAIVSLNKDRLNRLKLQVFPCQE